ncbi:MAG: hypothetical protein NTX24_05490 [Candidatus Pacearchaeota archaeon]|nr:hypothetical protein [Candidatus Pacearchaeota archaeon]
MATSIKTIYFDFDGVLAISESGGRAVSIKLSKETGIDVEKLLSIFKENGRAFIRGEENVDEFLEKFSSKLGVRITPEQLGNAYSRVPLNKPVFDLFPKIKASCSVGLISNNSKFRFDILKEKRILDIWAVFDKVYVSAILHEFKQNFILEFKDKGSSVLIDNDPKFLEEVSKAGMNIIYYDSLKHNVNYLLKEFRKLGIKI